MPPQDPVCPFVCQASVWSSWPPETGRPSAAGTLTPPRGRKGKEEPSAPAHGAGLRPPCPQGVPGGPRPWLGGAPGTCFVLGQGVLSSARRRETRSCSNWWGCCSRAQGAPSACTQPPPHGPGGAQQRPPDCPSHPDAPHHIPSAATAPLQTPGCAADCPSRWPVPTEGPTVRGTQRAGASGGGGGAPLRGRGGAAAVRVPDVALGTSLVLRDRRPLLKLTAARGQPLQAAGGPPGAGEWVTFLGSCPHLSMAPGETEPSDSGGGQRVPAVPRLATEMGRGRLALGRRR